MRRRIALVFASLAAVVAMACGGWLLDPAGSREQAGSQSPARPTTTGPLLYAAVTRQMAARGTATYTWSGTSGGGTTVAGTGSLRFLPSGDPGHSYTGMMVFNVRTIVDALGGDSSPLDAVDPSRG